MTVRSSARPGPPTTRGPGRMIALALSLTSLVVLTGCPAGDARDDHAVGPMANIARLTDALPTPTLDWRRCQALPAGPDPSTPGLQCAGLSVPRDYANPAAGSLRIEVSRRTDPNAPAGPAPRPVLISNPGGPGASGLFNTLGVDGAFGGRLAGHFDLVSFDPRGVNRSAPVDCGLTTAEAARSSGGQAPTTFASDASAAARSARSCTDGGDADSRFVTTNNTVRDVELIRRALGVERISWVGTSYGSELAAGYASLFPDHTDRVILDSPSDLTRPWWQVQAGVAAAADVRFDAVATVIAARDDEWRLGADVATVRARYLQMITDLERSPRSLGGEQITAAQVQSVRLTPALLDDGAIEPLALTMRYLLAVPGAPSAAQLISALELADAASGPAVEVNGQSFTQQIAAYLTVRCNDAIWPSPEHYRAAQAAEAKAFPITRGQYSMINACAFWPPHTPEPMIMTTDQGWTGRANVLLLSASGDIRAYPAGVQNTRRALGRRAVSITVEDHRHVVVGRNPCATDAALAWLLDDHPPTADRSC